MKKILIGLLSLVLVFAVVTIVKADKPSDLGFSDDGYNDTARIFNGTSYDWCYARGWTNIQCEAYFGKYVNDKLVMKWNAEWDRGNAENWLNPPYKAWTSNEWNGLNGGSGSNWHYKIVWVGSCGSDYTPLPNGGYCIWGQFETIMDQGIDPNLGPGHLWFAHADPTGYGAYFKPTPTP